MASFSQRMGLKPLQKSFQKESLDQELRNGLWNATQLAVLDYWQWSGSLSRRYNAEILDRLYATIWISHFKLPLDSMPSVLQHKKNDAYEKLRGVILSGPWNEALDLIEFIVKATPDSWAKSLVTDCNACFEMENSAYRIISKEIVEITDDIEIESIESAMSINQNLIKSHLQQSLHILSEKVSPDYRNAMKEAISAVEAACQAFSGKSGSSLGDCLKVVKAKHSIHPALEKALLSLYGYTSDSGGIRHALTDETSQPTFADAKFLLVSCTAFINYLWAIAAETGIGVE